MEPWIHTDKLNFVFSIIEQIVNITGEEHPSLDSNDCLSILFNKIKAKNWDWVLEQNSGTYTMQIKGGSPYEFIGIDTDIETAVYIAYYDALFTEMNQ